ncbi:uncharacterized protein FOMMEDRAFT_145701 [Fomitiporia mediterranea MF3/22]|uniref:uncharacterized protein n=1 Tax=Fomitiporia mediterranea (strain MF3/22) TaxID=694068 RepID=UPI0004407D63|nr:uncharacterized protein FOMMEDRAFT_145701 [Fomitiporia mediterranea MF3/22]EJD05066.1 hypothetical protein FOMMEDRAFT_145701 [Fomitiporia mediterranea MF3/22]
MHPHSALDPSFLGSFKRLFSHKGCYLDLDMTRRIDWHTRRSSSPSKQHPSFLDEPATKPPTHDLTILCTELRSLLPPDSDKSLWSLRIRLQQRVVTVRDVLMHLDRWLYAEIPATYWPECPKEQERIECAHRLRVKHLARTHGRSARSGARMSISGGGRGAPLGFMQVVECAELDEHGRLVKRDRKIASRIDWLGGKFFFAGLSPANGKEGGEVDFVLNMEAPWARRRRSLT